MKSLILALVLCLSLTGCGSIVNMLTDLEVYGGVKKGVRLIEHPYLPKTGEYFFPMIIIGVIDVPLSAVLDTILLPVTLTVYLLSDDSPENPY